MTVAPTRTSSTARFDPIQLVLVWKDVLSVTCPFMRHAQISHMVIVIRRVEIATLFPWNEPVSPNDSAPHLSYKRAGHVISYGRLLANGTPQFNN